MDFKERLVLAQKYVVERDERKRERIDEARNKCREASARVKEIEQDVNEIIKLYAFCQEHNIELEYVNGYKNFFFKTDNPVWCNWYFQFNCCNLSITIKPNGYTYNGGDYEKLTDIEEIYRCLGLHTAFIDLFPTFKLRFYKKFDNIIGIGSEE